MIKVNKICPDTFEHFDPQGNSLGFLNVFESTDLRCQIKENEASGYYIKFNHQHIRIQNDGSICAWPAGLYNQHKVLLERILDM